MKHRVKVLFLVVAILAVIFTGCQKVDSAEVSEKLVIGVAPGPYGDMFKRAIQPQLEERGYVVEVKEFSDYVLPNQALANKEITANMFQHAVYLEKFSQDHNLELSSVINIPTAAVGLYSNRIKSLDDLEEGSVVTIANDPTNLARALRLLEAAGLVTISENMDPTTASEKDIVENPKNLQITPVEAAQLPRTLESSDLAAINGNFAIAAGIDLSTAIVMETLEEPYKNLIAVRTEDLDKEFVKDMKEIVQSEAFREAINNPNDIFNSFQKPDWFE
ncbi:MetQ/NlpA family ABC transporter substrate-binding protein [Clostridium formicaceticum]|uniref:Lipoprotein n=1 Tax=Clostridium formicaceticum TaxID=1497 RepID=A0AAC9WEX9_9CLOT|nr:MetQ/NlpA family ABC transporter substrate-binding protein [Clostridium formicaceticum]AOY75918.1 metal ABC transporter substrate-binding protein [Clostridium formicaceticum]ARE86262.1 D-methionine-binding lipoprotein MetQ precursor [Clostridium formicaceticum]